MIKAYQACFAALASNDQGKPASMLTDLTHQHVVIVYKGLTRRAALWCYPPDLSDRLAFPLFMFAGSL